MSRDLEPQPMSASKTVLSRWMEPHEANVYGNVHGGSILKLIDETGAVAAWRHAGSDKVVTASLERMSFKEPVFIGDVLHVTATVRWTGRTSMIVGVRVEAEDPRTKEVRHTSSAHITFVALNKNNKPVPVPQVYAETPDEEERMERAKRVAEAVKAAMRATV